MKINVARFARNVVKRDFLSDLVKQKDPLKRGEISDFNEVTGSKFKISPFLLGQKTKFPPFCRVKIRNSPPFYRVKIHPLLSGQNSKFTPFYRVKIRN